MKRSFTKKLPEKSEDYHGYAAMRSNHVDLIEKGVQSVHMTLSYEESLKLEKAIAAATFAINRLHRGHLEGRSRGLCLSFKVTKDGHAHIAVIETDMDDHARTKRIKKVA